MEFEQNQYLKGLEHITLIYEAIQYRNPLKIKYQSFNQNEPQIFQLSPYYLKEYNNRWFLFGITDGYDNLTNLALDRILVIEQSNIKFKSNTKFDFSEYFEDIIGVTLNENEELQNIQLKVDEKLLDYIKTKPIHGSQKHLNKESEENIIELKLIPNYELETLLLSYADKITILHPKNLRDKINSRLNKALSNNSKT